IYTRPASGLVTEYQFRLVNEALSYDVTINSTFRTFRLSDFNAISPLTPGATYTATVVYEIYGFFYAGKDCNITVPGGARMANINTKSTEMVDVYDGFKAIASPNPFNGSFNLNMYTNSTKAVNVAIYDITGRLLETKEVNVDNLNNQAFGELYPAGVYNIVVTQDEEMQTVRVIKK
ncbi:MAG: T9SS type A sorting domain-containing protein, partial [Flavobacterium sp.]